MTIAFVICSVRWILSLSHFVEHVLVPCEVLPSLFCGKIEVKYQFYPWIWRSLNGKANGGHWVVTFWEMWASHDRLVSLGAKVKTCHSLRALGGINSWSYLYLSDNLLINTIFFNLQHYFYELTILFLWTCVYNATWILVRDIISL